MNKDSLLLIKFFKWVNIIGIFSGMLIILASILMGENQLVRSYSQSSIAFSEPLINLIAIIGFITSVLIVYGIHYKKPIGLYASMFLIIWVVILQIITAIVIGSSIAFWFALIPIVIYSAIGYYIWKARSYFGVD